jgi:hypothetical protein
MNKSQGVQVKRIQYFSENNSKKASLQGKVCCLYWVPQNWRNNSVGECQIMLANYEKNNFKKIGEAQKMQL